MTGGVDERWGETARDLQAGLRELLEGRCPTAAVRAADAARDGDALTSELRDFGLAELGADIELLAVSAYELGRALAPTTWVATAPVLAVLPELSDPAVDGLSNLIPASSTHAVVADGDGLLRLAAVGGEPMTAASGEIVRRPPPAGSADRRVGSDGARARLQQVGLVLHAARLAGAARGLLELVVPYAAEREQFGRPIASFQAVAFRLADMAIAVDAAELLVRRAAVATRDGARQEPFGQMAWDRACRSAEQVATSGHQVMGGYGFATEYDCQLFSRRIRAWTRLRHRPTAAAASVADTLLDPYRRDRVHGLWHHDVGLPLPRWARPPHHDPAGDPP